MQTKEARAAYQETHKEAIAAQRKQYQQTNKETIAAYRETHKEAIAAQRKQYQQTNKETIAAYQKQYRESHKTEKQKLKAEARRLKSEASEKAEADRQKGIAERKIKRTAKRLEAEAAKAFLAEGRRLSRKANAEAKALKKLERESKGFSHTQESKDKMSASQTARWEKRRTNIDRIRDNYSPIMNDEQYECDGYLYPENVETMADCDDIPEEERAY